MSADLKISFRLTSPYDQMLTSQAGRLGVSPSVYARARVMELLAAATPSAADDDLEAPMGEVRTEVQRLQEQVDRLAQDLSLYVQGILVTLGLPREDAAQWVAENFGAAR